MMKLQHTFRVKVFNGDGKLTYSYHVAAIGKFEARDKVIADLKEMGALERLGVESRVEVKPLKTRVFV